MDPTKASSGMPSRADWAFCCDASTYAIELGECVRKATTSQLLKRASDKNQARRAIPPLLGSEKTGPLYGAALPQQPHTART